MYMLNVKSLFYSNIRQFYIQTVTVSTMNQTKLLSLVQSCIPTLDNNKHKGQAGRIGIFGGSLEYTGAPYFSGISALKVGADLVHIFCASQAGTVIKSYSPELIVHPLLDQPNAINKITPWLERLHVIVIGPGLGRDSGILSTISALIGVIREMKIPLVIDADGLYLITQDLNLIKNFTSSVILTPNKIEYERLSDKINFAGGINELGNCVTVLKKGKTDEALSPAASVQWQYNDGGSGRRCGGQGDILSGTIATFLHWILSNKNVTFEGTDKNLLASSLACFAGSVLVRRCNEKAFKIKGRSMLASDMIPFLHDAFTELYEKKSL
ncbi:ATP-dependent (S)-NAD(P)H-hydrate dehydratase [Pieris rapae]|uniref:ATP-dependent (S)-NAD(P)H-hydrate dehydratase n=1 Tax=Pieris rapae TaxID=64459 RepID=UPI001E27E3D4|nr:ATP-dependent (S)-NAD(P)H-hydrate dehydratase [Pieris rapae]